MSMARELAQHVCAVQSRELPDAAIYWSKVALLDTVGVTLAGAIEAAPGMVAQVLDVHADGGPGVVWGTSYRAKCLDAALINGVSSHMLDFDNTSNTMAGHMSATMIPALIAAAEAYGGSGRDVLLGHTVGFEVGARLGHGLNFHHHEKGWHPTSTLGVFAVAAACARLLKLSVEQTEMALAMCASLASGIKANFGTMTKPLHAGHTARNGLMAALLARQGFTAHADAFEHKHGFFDVFNGAGNYDAEKILESWADPFDVTAPGAAYKQYACCAGAHSAIDACLELVNKHGVFDPAQIARIETWTAPVRLAHTNRPFPNSPLDAKFSVQYCAARALVHGKVLFEHFEGDAYRDAVIVSLLKKTQSEPFTEAHFPKENKNGAVVDVTMTDGRRLFAKVPRALGRTTENPIPLEQLQTKFKDCALKALAPRNVDAALGMIQRFEDVASIQEFTAVLLKAPAKDTNSGRARSAA